MEKVFILEEDGLQIPCCSFCTEEKPRRIVLGVHGLVGSMLDNIQRSLSEEMALFYSAVYRFDLPGHGESPCRELTLERCRRSLLAVAQHACREYPDTPDLCLFATGFGAYVTLTCLEELVDLGKNLRLVVQTPSVRMHDTLLNMARVSVATFRAMDSLQFAGPNGLELRYSMYKELLEHSVMVAHPIPMLILQGEKDDYISLNDILQFRRINEDSRLVIIPGASHRFLEEGAWDMVLDLTRDWFERQQVLLCDWI